MIADTTLADLYQVVEDVLIAAAITSGGYILWRFGLVLQRRGGHVELVGRAGLQPKLGTAGAWETEYWRQSSASRD